MKKNKYVYLFVLQVNYGYYGWEDLTASENRREVRNDLKAYKENEVGITGSFRDGNSTRRFENG